MVGFWRWKEILDELTAENGHNWQWVDKFLCVFATWQWQWNVVNDCKYVWQHRWIQMGLQSWWFLHWKASCFALKKKWWTYLWMKPTGMTSLTFKITLWSQSKECKTGKILITENKLHPAYGITMLMSITCQTIMKSQFRSNLFLDTVIPLKQF